ncbi:MAG: FkbM family methyltransferase [Verrucomicrobia bacterium]|nr:FkbM family methyltransferase [Verrucomicrobiota bacterium]MDA1005452.1 FkbM family methyltransferase [Verrucomicrobiota bacterium]
MAFKKFKARLRRKRLAKNSISVRGNKESHTLENEWDGWPIPSEGLTEDSLVYSFGIGNDIAWDLEMMERFNLQLHGFDPTPESIAWIKTQDLPKNFQFHDVGLSSEDGHLSVYPPKKPGRFNFTQEKLNYVTEDGHKPIKIPVKRLRSIMNELGHEMIDVLKIDIEGSEFEAIPDIFESKCRFDYLLVEIHYHFPQRSFEAGVDLIKRIEKEGFACFYISERGYEFGFKKI